MATDCCMARHATAVPPWTCDCPCHTQPIEAVESPEPPTALSPQEILRLGALTLQAERAEGIEQLLAEQRDTYQAMLQQDPVQLVEALLDRDRQLAQMGRQVADGRTASRMLREFVRGLLNAADYPTVKRVGDATKTGQIEKILEALGAEPADLRQLQKQGTTLGELESGEGRAEELAEGRRKA